jgi:RND family efflux transporter MFP subunit
MNATDRSMLPHAPPPHPHPPQPRGNRGLWTLAVLGLVVVLGGGGAYWAATSGTTAGDGAAPRPAVAQGNAAGSAIVVDVVHPQAGGIVRKCVQPGTVIADESENLYAKVSGFLESQTVDIGDRVKKGQVLAKISVPELEKQVQRDQAKVRHANATVEQMTARLKGAEAEAKAAESQVELAKAEVTSKTAFRSFRQKQFNRFKELIGKEAIDARLVDEKEDQYEAAVSAENAAKAQVVSAQLQAVAAKTKIAQAKADLDEANAEVGVAEAELAKTQELANYMTIKSKYNGVITKRNFFPGEFIRDASTGGDHKPLLSVERTDKVRVVVQVPDRDVPYVSAGDAAEVQIDALPGRTFKGKVSRWASAEDPSTRTMRTEIDLDNPATKDHPNGELNPGMYGRVTITLSEGAPEALRIPTAALVGKSEGGDASVRVIRGDHAVLVPIKISTDNGLQAEVVSGLTANDQVVVQTHGAVDDKTPVQVHQVPTATSAGPAKSGH